MHAVTEACGANSRPNVAKTDVERRCEVLDPHAVVTQRQELLGAEQRPICRLCPPIRLWPHSCSKRRHSLLDSVGNGHDSPAANSSHCNAKCKAHRDTHTAVANQRSVYSIGSSLPRVYSHIFFHFLDGDFEAMELSAPGASRSGAASPQCDSICCAGQFLCRECGSLIHLLVALSFAWEQAKSQGLVLVISHHTRIMRCSLLGRLFAHFPHIPIFVQAEYKGEVNCTRSPPSALLPLSTS